MRNVLTVVLTVDPLMPEGLLVAEAAACLRAGGLVAFPTETVYGLGVHALDAAAVRRLFAAKRRPPDDPLIVHVTTLDDVLPLVASLPDTAVALAARFWPGPLTLVLRRSPVVPDEVTGGLETVAIRIPAHPVARALIAAAALPVAAPSANLFSRPSPTRASHVLEDLDGRIDIVLDGGSTAVGVESTVLDLSGDTPRVLRPGAVSLDMLRALVPDVRAGDGLVVGDGPKRSPGMLTRHYSPRAPLTLYEGTEARVLDRIARDASSILTPGRSVGILLADEDAVTADGAHIIRLGSVQDPGAVAARLYAALRELDTAGVDEILVRGWPSSDGLGEAIADRLHRAAAGRIVRC